MKSISFTADVNGEKKELEVRLPTVFNHREAKKIYNKVFTESIANGAMLRTNVDKFLQEQNVWTQEKENLIKTYQQEMQDAIEQLAKGGININKAKQLAIRVRELRGELMSLRQIKYQFENTTAEGQAEDARFDYFVSCCVFDKSTGKQYFDSLEDYLNRSTEDASVMAATKLSILMYGLNDDFERTLPENKFLSEFHFVDDNLRLIDSKGRLIDLDGKLINEDGRFIDEEGNFIDSEGRPLNEDGTLKFERKPFLDDSGNEIGVIKEEEKTTNIVEESTQLNG